MSKMLISLTAAASAGALAIGLSAPATAQSASDSRIAEVIVYGNDPCPRSSDSAIVVCARKPETERYRIPERYRESGPPQTRESWANKAKSFEYVGRTGIMSCSAVGPGGHTGCLQNMIDRAKADGRWGRAYAGPATAEVPEDLTAALAASPEAATTFATLNGQNRYAVLHRIITAPTPASRANRLATLLAMVERGETPYPQSPQG